MPNKRVLLIGFFLLFVLPVIAGVCYTAAARKPQDEPAMQMRPFEEERADDPARYITFRIVDGSGDPVPYLEGRLRFSHRGTASHTGLLGEVGDWNSRHSGPDGKLFLFVGDALRRDIASDNHFTLRLKAYYGLDRQEVMLSLPETTPATVTVVWEHDRPLAHAENEPGFSANE